MDFQDEPSLKNEHVDDAAFSSAMTEAVQKNYINTFQKHWSNKSSAGDISSKSFFQKLLEPAIDGHSNDIIRVILLSPGTLDIIQKQGFKLLCRACRAENWTCVHLLLGLGGVPVDSRCPKEGETALLHLCRQQAAPMEGIGILLRAGADPNARKQGNSCLSWAVKQSRHPALILELIAFGANVKYKNPQNGQSVVHILTQQHFFSLQTAILRLLLEAGAKDSVDAQDAKGNTALFYSAGQLVSDDEVDTCLNCLLVEYSADPNIYRDVSPLHRACELGSVAAVEILVVNGAANVHACDTANGRTPLHYANLSSRPRKHEKIALLVLKGGANVNAKSTNCQRTILHEYVCRSAVAYDVETLCRLGCDIHSKDAFGCQPIHYAVASGQYAIVLQFLEAGASMEARDNGGRTPLFYFSGSCPNLQGLYANKLDPYQYSTTWPNKQYEHQDDLWNRMRRALMDSRREASDCLTLLLERRADARATDDNNNLPWFPVCSLGRRTCTYLMLQAATHRGLFCQAA